MTLIYNFDHEDEGCCSRCMQDGICGHAEYGKESCSDYDHRSDCYTQAFVCPYCGYVSMMDFTEGGPCLYVCNNCEEEFVCDYDITVDVLTSKKPEVEQ